jgi:hypothetical protein
MYFITTPDPNHWDIASALSAYLHPADEIEKTCAATITTNENSFFNSLVEVLISIDLYSVFRLDTK